MNWRSLPYEAYHQYFDFDQDKVFGEVTPNYIYWPKSLWRTQVYNPDAQIERLLRLFPREQVLFLTSDQLWHDEAQTLSHVCDFLAIYQIPSPASSAGQKYVLPVDSREIPTSDTTTVASLNKRFRDKIIRTAKITGLDLNHWLDPEYEEPMSRS